MARMLDLFDIKASCSKWPDGAVVSVDALQQQQGGPGFDSMWNVHVFRAQA